MYIPTCTEYSIRVYLYIPTCGDCSIRVYLSDPLNIYTQLIVLIGR